MCRRLGSPSVPTCRTEAFAHLSNQAHTEPRGLLANSAGRAPPRRRKKSAKEKLDSAKTLWVWSLRRGFKA
jgi:hypothetical protein